ncbi:hypothetical protein R80B4_01713 [Fibrobacteres bacterium R8-0-B4]
MDITDIAGLCRAGALRWTSHALGRMFQRGIGTDDVKNVLVNGEIIERYPSDYPFPSCLMLGRTKAGESLHVVCGSNGAELWLITAYLPDRNEWSEDCRRRRK